MHVTDWLPTLYSVGGGDVRALGKLDGFDMWRYLSQGIGSPRVEMLYNIDNRFMNASALRLGRYKLVLDATRYMNERYLRPGGSRPHNDLDKLLARSTAAKVLRGFYKKDRLKFPKDWRERATLKCGLPDNGQFYPNDAVHLFDIMEDPCELNNLASSHPEVVTFLKMRIAAYQAEAMPVQHKPKDPAGFPEKHNGTWAPWGWDDVSFHGSSQIPTPNIDALAADGIILNSYYTQPFCTPSRAALMTGLYPMRTGMQGAPISITEPWGLPLDVRIMPQYFKELGYETHLVGKWHLGCYTRNHTPTSRGFDSFYGFYNGEEDYFTHSITHPLFLVVSYQAVHGGNVEKLPELDGHEMWKHLSNGWRSPRTELLYNIGPLPPAAAIRDTKYKLVVDSTGLFNQRYLTTGGRRPQRDLDELLLRSEVAKVLRGFYGKDDGYRIPEGWRRRATLKCGEWTERNFSSNDSVYLFDIVNDPCELKNLAKVHPNGWNDVSFHGSNQIPTPNLDVLASEGILLHSYYTMQLCTPSRAALLTGLYPIRTGMQSGIIGNAEPWGLPLNLKIMPEHFKDLGYEVHLIGKWHLGFFKTEYTPPRRGFDTFYGYYTGRADYYDHTSGTPHVGLDLRDNEQPDWGENGTYAYSPVHRKVHFAY
ncbi:hypothetical protein MTO96_022626 [Rhipicephalus appendiculatus]